MNIHWQKYVLFPLIICISAHSFASYTLGSWSYASSLNIARSDNVAVIARDTIVYTFGGLAYTNTPYPVEHTTLRPDGTLTSWTIESNQMVMARQGAVGFSTDSYVYAICGENASSILTTIERAPINSDGTLGTWTTIGACTVSFGYSALIQYNQYIYVISGYQGYNVLPYIYRTIINPDGSLGTWTLLTSQLVTAGEGPSAILINTTMYVVSGFNNGYIYDVEKATISSDGELSAFTTLRGTTVPHNGCGLFYDGQYLNVVGGAPYFVTSYYSERANINTDGTLDAWEEAPYLQTELLAFGYVQTKDDAYVIGGTSSDGGEFNTVQYAPILNTTDVKKSEWEIFE